MTASKKGNRARKGPSGRSVLLSGAALLAMAAALVQARGTAWAAAEDAPQVLTSELNQTQTVTEPKLTATFVIVGSHPIRKVTINGEAQSITDGDTVQITKEFEFKTRQTVISVRAEDESGNATERYFVVNYGAAPQEKRWSVHGSGELRYEVDDNPTDDVGLPYTVSGVDVKGVIPPSQRPDVRTTASANVIATNGAVSVFGGALDVQYAKAVNQDLNTILSYGGAGYRFRLTDTSDFLANYIYSNLNVGSKDYATLNTLSGGYESRSQDDRYARRHLFELDVSEKSFASSSQTAGAIGIAKWDYLRTQPSTLSTYTSLIQAGNATEGVKLTDYDFIGGDWDWHNRWDSGFRWDLGFGYQFRNFPNNPKPLTKAIGSTQVDNLIRASTGLGWQWNAQWAALLGYRYLTDVSNTAPYVRSIYGLSVTGGF